MGKHLTQHQLGQIFAFNKAGWGCKRIANELERPVATIKSAIKRMKSSKICERKVGSGRARKTNQRENRAIVRHAIINCFDSAENIRMHAKTINKISRSTIKRRIHEKGINGYVAAKKPFVNEQNRKKRLEWALAHKDWSLEQWNNVLFSDESQFVLRWKGQQLVWRRRA